MLKKVLTIACSESGGGTGIQADIKTITAHGMYAMSAVTALTAQNTSGACGIYESPPEFVAQQLDCIFTGSRPDAVKIGMAFSAGIISVIAEKLVEYRVKNIVIDPVSAASGGKLFADGMAEALINCLFPLGLVITPNIPAAEALSGIDILSGRNTVSQQNVIRAAQAIAEKVKCAVLIKGGHLECSADDLLYTDGIARWFPSERVGHPGTRGTGSTLSSAITCNLAAGYDLTESIRRAKEYVTGALKAGLTIDGGRGLLDHMWRLTGNGSPADE